MDLATTLRERRSSSVTVGAITFTVLRPRALELAAWRQSSMAEIAVRSVCGWSGVTAGDITGDTDDMPVEFSRELADEWLPDRADLVVPIWDKVQSLISEHHAKVEDAEKN